MFKKEKISGWANFPVIESEVASPGSVAAIRDFLLKKNKLIARGNARSYGDASLAETVISTRKLNKLLDFDPKTGLLTCQSGILLSEILEWSLPLGWFFMVAPGTKYITVGGAIAADIHGKNHPADGSFSRWVTEFKLMQADGTLVKCSRTENAGLFWKTIGGMGLTGIITEATFQLRRVSTLKMWQRTQKTETLEQVFDLFEAENPATYQIAWIDCLHKKGRSVFFSGEHIEAPMPENQRLPAGSQRPPISVPFWIKLLNPLSINAFNLLYWLRAKPGEQEIPFDTFFFPLDAVGDWNRFYGRTGFIQYQFAMPENTIRAGARRVLDVVQASGENPLLVVLKKFGDQPREAINSFPARGYAIAMDLPMTAGIPDLVKKLDAVLFEFGGKTYLAKDAMSDPRLSGLKADNFPENRFESLQSRRIFPKT